MKYYKVTNTKDGSIPWVCEGDARMVKMRDEILVDLPYMVIEEITKEEFDKEAAQ